MTGRGKLARFGLIGGRPANLLCNFFSPDRNTRSPRKSIIKVREERGVVSGNNGTGGRYKRTWGLMT